MRQLLTKLFLIAGAIVILPNVAIAAAGDAVAANKWMYSIPDSTEMEDATADQPSAANVVKARIVPIRGGTQSIKRHQKFYMSFHAKAADAADKYRVNQSGTSVICTVGTDCVSAPLFIASTSALICMDEDIGGTGMTGDQEIYVRFCADSTCAAAATVRPAPPLNQVAATLGDQCGEIGGGSEGFDQLNTGGQWISVELFSASDNAANEDVVVWVVGQ